MKNSFKLFWLSSSKKAPCRDGVASDVILTVAGNRCKMENCVATMTGKEWFLRMLDAKKMKNSFTLLWLNSSKKAP